MNRRHFLALTGAASVAAATATASAAEGSSSGREIYELMQVSLDKQEQRKELETFLKEALIPALNRLGIKPVGAFAPAEGFSPVHLLLPHPSMESVLNYRAGLAEDGEFTSAGENFLMAPATAPAYKRIESSLLVAFTGWPRVQTPVKNPGRVFQLRTYESPSYVTNLKKIEMFNDAGEIRIFREVGLTPVFFGQAIVGSKLPNLTYMLGFKSMEEEKAAWRRFGAHPDWKRLSKMPEYADKTILSNITNLPVVPVAGSQI